MSSCDHKYGGLPRKCLRRYLMCSRTDHVFVAIHGIRLHGTEDRTSVSARPESVSCGEAASQCQVLYMDGVGVYMLSM